MFYIYIQLLIFFDPLENLYSRALIKNVSFFLKIRVHYIFILGKK